MGRDRLRAAWLRILALVALATQLLGAGQCSYRGHVFGGTGSGTTVQTALGPVSGFGSVFVGGVEYATSAAAVTVDGAAGHEVQLQVGQLASLAGSLAAGGTRGTATELRLEDKLVGPVTALALVASSVTVLGQSVVLNGDTSVGPGIDPADIRGLNLGDVIVVDGVRTSTGLIATRLDRAAPGRTFRVVGRVSGLRAFAQTFTLGGTTIDFSAAGAGLPPGLADGAYVAATGTAVLNATTLRATLVEAKTEAATGARGDGGSLYGAITRFTAPADFDVAGQAVTTDATTSWVNGSRADLGLDAVVEVSGQYDGTGRLAASRLERKNAPTVRVVGPVDALDPVALTVQIAGITLTTDARTRWDDRGPAPLRAFGYAALASGDWLEIRGVATVTRLAATAHVLERRVPPALARIELQDLAAAVADPGFTLTGVHVDARYALFVDAAGLPLSRAAFFAQAAGRLVRARGMLNGTTLNTDLVALRN